MRKSLAECMPITHMCWLCQYIAQTDPPEDDLAKHYQKDHTDEEGIDATGWDLKDYEGDEEENDIPKTS